MSADARVVITGLGVVCPIGIGRSEVWENFRAGKSGLSPITSFDTTGLKARVCGEIVGFEPAEYVKPRKALKVMARDAQLTVAAAAMARDDAALPVDSVDPERFGVIFGGEVIRNPLTEVAQPFIGSMENGEYDFARWGTGGLAMCYPLSMLKLLPNMPACHISIGHDARGPNNTICMAEASGLSALGEATRVIQRGQADVMMGAAASSRVNAYDLLRHQLGEEVSSEESPLRACRPFDVDRDGQVRGEGAAVLILESGAHAASRGASPMAAISGWGAAGEPVGAGKTFNGDCIHRAIMKALADAKLTAKDVGFVVAHGLATRAGDRAEARALRESLPGVPVFAAKGYFGCLGTACGTVEAALAAMALAAGELPPTPHCDKPDPECGIDVVHGRPLTSFAGSCVIVSYTPAGQASALVLTKP
ncbi:MAG: beta-ketoacyl-[acyl-carrier-protein] synthase family protein [Planctomycetaceae bacterium]|nr:beta-ketoacyl-[acyl-carrier-protein] synthase family protein [Planctomycetaceae bacterium]